MTGEQSAAKAAELSCPACGEAVYTGEDFCEACGHRLGEKPPAPPQDGTGSASPGRHAPAASARPCPGCGATAIDADGYCENCGVRQPTGRDHLELELPAPGSADAAANGLASAGTAGANGVAGAGTAIAAGVSDRGMRYSRNEDALALVAHAAGVAAVVSDGVGSSPHPEDASLAAAQTGSAELVARLDAGENPEDATRAAVLRAAEAVAALAPSPAEAPSCTFVSAITRPGSLTVGWIGDSRAYWIAAGEPPAAPDPHPAPSAANGSGPAGADGDGPDTAELNIADLDTGDMAELTSSQQLTDDDSWAAIMVAEGAMTEAEAEAHPNAHVITAWLGADAEEIRPHVRTFRPGGPGTLLVCSDGLWNYFPKAADLAALLAGATGERPAHPAADPLGAARTLVRHALDAGGRDNITVAVIPLPTRDDE